MAKAELKTKKTAASVDDFIGGQKDEQVRDDCRTLIKLMSAATKDEPKMWGAAIVGFGHTTLKYDSGRELDWMIIGFSPRKANLTLYGLGSSGKREELLAKLGKHTTGKGCLYIKRLADVDMKVLTELIQDSVGKKGGK
ncbi:MAG TPA: DUF1801 domain-containing protein [Flavobacteriales bacterium]|nr:DUF1801 domain-containing protein [Flavobacteriales bacterium]